MQSPTTICADGRTSERGGGSRGPDSDGDV
jgi:hypothetical protein